MFADTSMKRAVSRVWVCLIAGAQSLVMIMNFTSFATFFLEKFFIYYSCAAPCEI